MKLFAKKTGVVGAPTDPVQYAKLIDQWLAGRSFEEKARLVAGVRTGGEVEARVRFLKDGGQSFSVWLMVRGKDEGIRLIPAPTEQEAQHGGDVR